RPRTHTRDHAVDPLPIPTPRSGECRAGEGESTLVEDDASSTFRPSGRNDRRAFAGASAPGYQCPVNLRLKGKQDRQQNGHDKSPKKSKTRRKIKSTIKIKSRTSCTRQRNAGRPALRRDLAPTPALALSSRFVDLEGVRERPGG